MPPLPVGPVNFSQLTSPVLFGGLLDFLLFGALTVQVYVYSICFPNDGRVVKVLVYSIYLAMFISLCLDAADMHFWFGAGFGDLSKFARTRYSGVTSPMIGSLVALCVQLFFAYRISMFRNAAWLGGVVVLISLMQAAGGIGGGITLYLAENGNFELLLKNISLIYMWLVGSAVADVIIAVAMSYLLTDTAEPGTHHIVKRVVRLIVETNALTAVVAIVGVVLFTINSRDTFFLLPTMVLPSIYANTLLVLLNNRASPSRQPSQRSVPSNTTNNVTSSSEGTMVRARTPGHPSSLYGYEASDDVPMKTMSPPPGSHRSRRTSLDKSPNMSLDNTVIPSLNQTRSMSPRRSDVTLPFQAAFMNNTHPTIDLERDFAVHV